MTRSAVIQIGANWNQCELDGGYVYWLDDPNLSFFTQYVRNFGGIISSPIQPKRSIEITHQDMRDALIASRYESPHISYLPVSLYDGMIINDMFLFGNPFTVATWENTTLFIVTLKDRQMTLMTIDAARYARALIEKIGLNNENPVLMSMDIAKWDPANRTYSRPKWLKDESITRIINITVPEGRDMWHG